MVTGGDIVEMVVSNVDLGGPVRFFGVAGEDSTFIAGGFKNEDNGAVDGGGRLIVSKNRKVGTIEATFSCDMSQRPSEVDVVTIIQNSLNESTFTVQLSNDEVWSGKGTIVGEPQLSGNKSTITIKVASGLGFVLQ